MDAPVWKPISDNAKQLLKKLINKSPSQRYDSQQALQHPWFQEQQHPPLQIDLNHKVHSLLQFRNMNFFLQDAMEVFAQMIDPREIENLTKEFHVLDISNLGYLDDTSMQTYLATHPLLDTPEVQDILSQLLLGSQHLSYQEYVAAQLIRSKKFFTQDNVKKVFQFYDTQNQQRLTTASLTELMTRRGLTVTPQQVQHYVDGLEQEPGKGVTFECFAKAFHSAQ